MPEIAASRIPPPLHWPQPGGGGLTAGIAGRAHCTVLYVHGGGGWLKWRRRRRSRRRRRRGRGRGEEEEGKEGEEGEEEEEEKK